MARRAASIICLTLLLVAFAQSRNQAQQQPSRPMQLPAAASEAPPQSYDTPPAITQVDGSARLLRQGQSQAAVANMPLIEGDRLTTQTGRLAVTFPDGSLLHIDRGTSIDFLSMSLVRLHEGRVILVTAGRDDRRSSMDYQVDAAAGSVRVQSA